MTVRMAASTYTKNINDLNGHPHKLIITVRNRVDMDGHFLTDETLGAMVKHVGRLWVAIWHTLVPADPEKNTPEVIAAMDDVFGLSACDRFDVAPSLDDPYVTIWNRNWDGLSVTVHSWDTGQVALSTAKAMIIANDIDLIAAPTPATQYALPPASIDTIGGDAMPASVDTPDAIAPMLHKLLTVETRQQTYDGQTVSIPIIKTQRGEHILQYPTAIKAENSVTPPVYADKTKLLYQVSMVTAKSGVSKKGNPYNLIEISTPHGDFAVFVDGGTNPHTGYQSEYGSLRGSLVALGFGDGAGQNWSLTPPRIPSNLYLYVKTSINGDKEYYNVQYFVLMSETDAPPPPPPATVDGLHGDGLYRDADGGHQVIDDIPF